MNKCSLFFLRHMIARVFFLYIIFMCKITSAAFTHNNESRFNQERAFYERLTSRCFDVDFSSSHVQLYYKKIDCLSKPKQDKNFYTIASVMREGKPVEQNSDGAYLCGDCIITLSLDDQTKSHKDTDITIQSDSIIGVQYLSTNIKREVCLPLLESMQDLVHDKFITGSFLLKKTVHQVAISQEGGRDYILDIEIKNKRQYPIKVQGVAVLYDSSTEKTEIFFDFTDLQGKTIDYYTPVFKCKHLKYNNSDKTLYFVRDHQLFEFQAEEIFSFFNSPESYMNWIPDSSDFYAIKKHRIISFLPSCYSDSHHFSAKPKDPLVWVFGADEEHECLYEIHSPIDCLDSNDYLYSSHDGTLSATINCKVIAQEFLNSRNNSQLHCLLQVVNPVLKVHHDITIAGGHKPWPVGMYKKTVNEDDILWERVEDAAPHHIKHIISHDQHDLNVNYGIVLSDAHYKEMTAQENKKWGDAAQSFFHHFDATIHHCDHELLNRIPLWNKLMQLDVSRLQLNQKNLIMPSVLKVISSLHQLTALNFSYNNPIVSFDENFATLAERGRALYISLGACLHHLKHLQSLHIQGLWLQQHEALGKGVNNGVSKEVAVLTGVINHKHGEGVTAVVDRIYKLPKLENLSIDAIPSHGSSFVHRSSGIRSYLLATQFIAAYCDGSQQEESLKKLSSDCARKLVQAPALKKLHIFSPGGNCVDYCSKEFTDHIKNISQANQGKKITVCRAILGQDND